VSAAEEREILLSQLVDNELPADQAGLVLIEALEDAESCRRLRDMLKLRQTLAPWRRQEPPRAIVVAPPVPSASSVSHTLWRPVSLAAAAVLGGVLVASGFYLDALLRGNRALVTTDWPSANAIAPPGKTPDLPQSVAIVTPEERREIARAFALHESVAGPLSWYAADEATIQVAPAEPGEELQEPIAVVLRLNAAEGCQPSEGKTYAIVCRSNAPAVIELPRSAAMGSARLRLLSTVTEDGVQLQYALAADGLQTGPDQSAAVVGRRHVGSRQTSLGQLAWNDCLVNVDASAWPLREEQTN